MPELPEVTTTVRGLSVVLRGRKFVDVWTDLGKSQLSRPHYKNTFKDRTFFEIFKRGILGTTFVRARRRGKNILIDLSNKKTILVHMKMTGHLLYGNFSYDKKSNIWTPTPGQKNKALLDPFNKFIHAVFVLDNGKVLAFSDARKFGKITLDNTNDIETSIHLEHLGPEPLDRSFTFPLFKDRLLKKSSGKIKQVLMDQSIIAGIGNIYSDEMLWRAGIHPESKPGNIPPPLLKKLYASMKETLDQGIDFGGDSTSDYRDIYGKPGKFQSHHHVYQRTGEKCSKRGCTGVILRKVIGGRSSHYCSVHQIHF